MMQKVTTEQRSATESCDGAVRRARRRRRRGMPHQKATAKRRAAIENDGGAARGDRRRRLNGMPRQGVETERRAAAESRCMPDASRIGAGGGPSLCSGKAPIAFDHREQLVPQQRLLGFEPVRPIAVPQIGGTVEVCDKLLKKMLFNKVLIPDVQNGHA